MVIQFPMWWPGASQPLLLSLSNSEDPQALAGITPTSGSTHYSTPMQASEATQLCAPSNQFWVYPMLQPDSNIPSMYESGIQHPLHLPSSPTPITCGDAPSPSDSHLSSECSSMPLQLYDLQKLEAEMGALFEGLSGNAPALQVLTEIRSEIHNFAWIDEGRAENLVVPHGSFFYCPSLTCPRNRDGWDRLDRARDHIWADHLGRYYLCLWIGCARTFKQSYECSNHICETHQGDGRKFVCYVCKKALAAKFNLNRHMRDIHQLPTQTRTRRVVNRLRC